MRSCRAQIVATELRVPTGTSSIAVLPGFKYKKGKKGKQKERGKKASLTKRVWFPVDLVSLLIAGYD